ncbi:MAG: hypothetical protein C3F13_13465 [Anaerolineales bacterium]|nr:MAG: hypothetical protein C3F13_13465 [Anaerolineales bacterium]
MKKSMGLFILLLFALLLPACSLVGSQGGMIKPGDKVGDFLVTQGQEGNFTYGFTVACAQMSDATTYTCEAIVGENIYVSTGIYVTDKNASQEDILTNSKYQLFINDQPVDLESFGLVEYTHPGAEELGMIHFANVVITTDRPGEITVRDEGVYDNGEPFSSTSTYVFSQP